MAALARNSSSSAVPVFAGRHIKPNSKQGNIHDRTQTFCKTRSADHGWLKARHHFSFGSHYDPGNMGHGSLRVWNDDEIAPNTGFPAHPMPTWKSSPMSARVRSPSGQSWQQGPHRSRRRAGDERRLRRASLRIQSGADQDKIFQIWIERHRRRPPTWGAKPFPKSDRSGNFVTIASGFDDDMDALPIRADARVLATTLKAGGERGIYAGKTAISIWCGGGRGRDQRRAGQRPRRRRNPQRGAAENHSAGRLRTGAGRRGVRPF